MLLVGAFGHVRVGKRGDCECGMAWDGLFRLFLKKLLICFGEATWVNQSPKWRKCPECSRVLVDVRGAGLFKLTGMQRWPQMTTRCNRVQPGNKCTHASQETSRSLKTEEKQSSGTSLSTRHQTGFSWLSSLYPRPPPCDAVVFIWTKISGVYPVPLYHEEPKQHWRRVESSTSKVWPRKYVYQVTVF